MCMYIIYIYIYIYIYAGVLLLAKSQAEACSFTKINTPPWVFFYVF